MGRIPSAFVLIIGSDTNNKLDYYNPVPASHRFISSSDSLGLSYGAYTNVQQHPQIARTTTYHVSCPIDRRKGQRSRRSGYTRNLAINLPVSKRLCFELVFAIPFKT